ncbi:hypothetical protein EON64_12280 [archaeon]|nr:MAG: hypothetical protein EON64_12280 [archaeon]
MLYIDNIPLPPQVYHRPPSSPDPAYHEHLMRDQRVFVAREDAHSSAEAYIPAGCEEYAPAIAQV